jgi:microcystin-dependent protein
MGDASSITSIPDSQIPASYDDSQSLSQPTSLTIHQTIIPDSQPLAASQESQALYYAAQPEQSNTSQSAVVRSNAGGSRAMTKETDKSISIPDIAKVGGCLSVALI